MTTNEELFTVTYKGKERTVFAPNIIYANAARKVIAAAKDGVLTEVQMRGFCPRLIMGRDQTMELFPALLTIGLKEYPLWPREKAIAEFRALVAQYGIQWTARVPEEAYDRMRRVHDVLSEDDCREALRRK
jgi:hypothetical protein